MSRITMEKLVAFCKTHGFVYQGSEIYGGLANTWDYGPLGVEVKNNIKKAWWKKFIQEIPSSFGIDASILMNPKVWVASGHVGGFSDPLMDCKDCQTRHRSDNLIENHDYLTMSQIAKKMGYKVSEIQRMVEYLHQSGYLHKSSQGGFYLTSKLADDPPF